MFKRILVPLDGSPRAEQVLPVAAHIAQAAGGTMVLVNVVNATQEAITYGLGGAFIPPDAIKGAIAGGRTYLEQLIQRTHLTGMAAIDKVVVIGNPAEKILSLAEEQHCDLIMLASHGYTGFKQWLMGSVAEKVARHARVPVLLIRDGEPLQIHLRADGSTVVRALVPLDLPAHTQDVILPAAKLVAALASPGQGVLHLTQVVVVPEDASEREKESLLAKTRTNLDTIGQQVRENLRKSLEAEYLPKVTWAISMDSDIAEGIARVAENGEETPASGRIGRCNLIAMTTHGLSGIQGWITGSITNRVLHTTRLPLLITRPSDVLEKDLQHKHQHEHVSI